MLSFGQRKKGSPEVTPARTPVPARARFAQGPVGHSTDGLPAAIGNQAVLRMLRNGTLQTKLEVNTPGDKHEREADRVADEVVRMPLPAMSRPSTRASAGAPVQSAFPALPGRGQPLPQGVRSQMEPRFAHDFGGVRIHTGAQAHQLARAISAQAFTVGSDIVFGAGHFTPETERGKHLLAHELTHVVQQSNGAGSRLNEGGGRSALSPITQSSPSDAQIHRQEDPNAAAQTPGPAPAQAPADAGAAAEEGQNRDSEVEWVTQGPQPGAPGATDAQAMQTGGGGAVPTTGGTAEITLETGNTGASPINNAVHQQICVNTGNGKDCFSFAANGAQLPQFSSSWLGWASTVVGAILKGEIYNPGPVPGATVVSRHTPTAAQAARWRTYMRTGRLGTQDGYSVLRHNCRTFSQWEFRDAPSHW